MAASCSTAPSSSQKRFRAGLAAAVSGVIILASYHFSLFIRVPEILHVLGAIAIAVLPLVLVRSIVTDTHAGSVPQLPSPASPRNLAPALVIGFLPSALLLGAIAVSSAGKLSGSDADAMLWFCSIASVVCCFVASFMLFTRKTAGAVAGGILLLALNGFIAFFFGCCASLKF
jgi:hypothetical protein